MIGNLIIGADYAIIAIYYMLLFLAGFFLTLYLTDKLKNVLPHDQGKKIVKPDGTVEEVQGGAESRGKTRGTGIIFILVFACIYLVFMPGVNVETAIYTFVLIGTMLSGYLDDAAKIPWSELKKGILDFVLAAICAVNYAYHNGTEIYLLFMKTKIELPVWLFIPLAILFIFAAINVVNCTDGVDGLCASLSIISIVSYIAVFTMIDIELIRSISDITYVCLLMLACIIGYLWYNAYPSQALMGDAGSRPIGVFLAILALQSGYILLFIPLCFVFIIDGGLGLFKITVRRVFKIKNFLDSIRTPVHDDVRKYSEKNIAKLEKKNGGPIKIPERDKNKNWSDPQIVTRFAMIQLIISACTLFATWGNLP
ncbi:MAG TPA: phospho-N-acetylmuramoyl-pentapeptide-transferase [Lachnospiraceae bacterium]|nr:phospho-N-acetylmuramoyl-pentapeptide-transferase [Lachnospiraceae bacterium]HBZ90087.1 phospho-N-acetylmuramoyl-pentapeptide-transferase [Lachnospiraceae bacterium]